MRKLVRVVALLLLSFCLCSTKKAEAAAAKKALVVVIDPGHGGKEAGAEAVYQGKRVREKDLNLIIAKELRKELKTYKNVKVYMTRTDDRTVGLEQRVRYAKKKNADLLISIHLNAKGPAMKAKSGACVLVSRGTYRRELAKASVGTANYIRKELKKAGARDNGLLKRAYPSKYYYPNKTIADYYSIIRNSVLAGMPGIIVEHAFLDNASDYERLLSSKEKLKKLGVLDATGIARYFGLAKKDGSRSYKAKGERTKYLSKHWLLIGNKKYYVYNNGSYATGWKKIGKKWYKFSKKGVLLKTK